MLIDASGSLLSLSHRSSSERTAYEIVVDLTEAGYVVKEKDGRRNRCKIQGHLPLRETVTRERTIGEVLNLLAEDRRLSATGGQV
ncbi:MAG: hypothetical protein DLM54_02325 [Acidimicrobiales bacterium]|nr:MAG: hypothetical protein DLM54_02325 [Acidimicrobiales bacterium]